MELRKVPSALNTPNTGVIEVMCQHDFGGNTIETVILVNDQEQHSTCLKAQRKYLDLMHTEC